MSQENVKHVEDLIAAYNRGDLEAALEGAAPDFELDWSRSLGPMRGTYSLDQARKFFAEFRGTFESVQIEAEEFIDAGDYVIVPNVGYVRGRDGITAQARSALVWRFRDGSVTHCTLYQDKAEALKAVGLPD